MSLPLQVTLSGMFTPLDLSRAWWLMLLGLTFLAGRLINAYGMSTGAHQLRVVGTAANLSGLIFVLLTLAITLV